MKKSPHPTIAAEIAELREQINELDLPGKTAREGEAAAAQQNFKSSNPQIPPMSSAEKQLLVLISECQQAHSQRADAERQIASITQEINRLEAILGADGHVVQAQKKIETAAGLVEAARKSVDVAQHTHTEIEGLIAAEKLAFEKARKDAAGAVLSQIKAGKPGKLPPVSRELFEALTLAQVSAASELTEAQQVYAQCLSGLKESQHEHAQALSEVTGRTLHLMAHEYAQALLNHKTATYACGRRFDEPDLALLVRQLEHEAESAELEEMDD